jgi:hypothetical protein
MMKKLALLAALFPLAAFAQGAGPAAAKGPGPGPGGPGCENCRGGRGGPASDEEIAKMEKRGRLARNLGLAEALDLDTAQATKLADALAKNDEKRVALHKQMRDAGQLLRRAAGGEKATAADVDGALAKFLDARAQLNALDKEAVAIVTKDLSPEKKARAALFLGRFEHRMGPGGMGPGMGPGMGGGRGRGRGMGPGMMGPGMGHGPGCKDCPWDAE